MTCLLQTLGQTSLLTYSKVQLVSSSIFTELNPCWQNCLFISEYYIVLSWKKPLV